MRARAGFTLLELLLAVTIMAIVTTVAYLTFSAATSAWMRGTQMADGLHHADYVIDQLAMGLRSAYSPETRKPDEKYGFMISDDGNGENAHDVIGWTKLGGALVGNTAEYAGAPHRVEVTVTEDQESGRSGFAVRSWRLDGHPEDFDPQEEVEFVYLSPRVTGFNCRMQDPEQEEDAEDDEIEWIDDWEFSNRVPYAVELTLYVEPGVKDAETVEVRRIVEIPMAEMSWNPVVTDGGKNAKGRQPRRAQPSGGGNATAH